MGYQKTRQVKRYVYHCIPNTCVLCVHTCVLFVCVQSWVLCVCVHTCVLCVCAHMCITIYLVEFSFRKGRFLALSPKCYWAYNDDTKETKTGMKGVSTVGARDIGLESFINCLYHDQDVKVISRELRKNKHQQMIYCETTKNALNPIFKKFRVQTDKISCLPLCKDGKFL